MVAWNSITFHWLVEVGWDRISQLEAMMTASGIEFHYSSWGWGYGCPGLEKVGLSRMRKLKG